MCSSHTLLVIFSAMQLLNFKEMSGKATHCEEKSLKLIPDCMGSLRTVGILFIMSKNDILRYWVSSGPGIQCRILCVSVYSYIVCWVSGLLLIHINVVY